MNLSDYKKISTLSGVYKIVNSENGKVYIGSSVNLRNRIRRHNYELRNKCHNNTHLQRAFDLNQKFSVEVLSEHTSILYENLLLEEKEYIEKYDAVNTGYNQLLDNSLFFKKLNKTSEHINQNRAANSKPVLAFNRYTGEIFEEFQSISDAARFFNTSSSNISQVCKGRKNFCKDHVFCYKTDFSEDKSYKYDKHWSQVKGFTDQHKNALKLTIQAKVGITVYKYNSNGKLVATYNSRAEAERQNDMSKEYLRGKIDKETPLKGFFYKSNKI